MQIRINFGFILFYFAGGLLGLIVALIILHSFHILEIAGRQEHTFLYHWWQDHPPTHGLTITVGFVLMGFLTAGWTVIRERLKAQKAETKELEEISRAKTEMMSFASHQLRTPLSSVKFAARMLLGGDFGKLTQGQQEILAKICSTNEELEGLIGDFLDVSKLELGKLEISLKRVGLADLEKEIKQVAERLRPLIEEKNLNFKYSSSLNYKLFTPLDLKRIKQVIENLFDNAIGYTPSGGKIEIFLENDKNNFKASISDSGIGIPKKEQPKIFSKFFRAINARKLQSTGAGLGLYLCKKIIEGHQGKIWFISEEGKGTTFSFTIPLKAKVEIEELFRKI